MPIPRKEANEFLRKTKLRYGSVSVGDDCEHIDIFSDELPIAAVPEYEKAEEIGKKHGLSVINQDFGLGEKAPPKYETVYSTTCTTLDELRKAPEKIATAITELEKEIRI